MPKKKEDKPVAYYIRLNSLLDLARHVCDFTNAVRPINAIDEDGKHRLFSIGERIGDIRILYYYDSDKMGQFCFYNPGEDAEERLELKSGADFEASDLKLYKIPLIELMKNPYPMKKKAKFEVMQVRVKDFRSLVKALLSKSTEDDSGTPEVYGFFDKGVHYIGSYDLFYEHGAEFFAYAKVDQKETFCSISYDYTNGLVETSRSFSGKSHMYVRVINLAEPFPFFKA
jgi:hypothetical protein